MEQVGSSPIDEDDLRAFVVSLPKAELHLHIEGTLEPELMLALAERNGIDPPFATVAEARAAYNFSKLDDFLTLYYAATDVLRTAADFEELTWAYLQRAHADGVVHVEPFFDPQSHLPRGVPMSEVVGGITAGLRRGEDELGISWRLIMCFLRHLSEGDAFATLAAAEPHLASIDGVGLDSSETGNPPSKFARVFAEARKLRLRAVAHAGEEGPAEYIWEAIDLLLAERIDHGVRAQDDPDLMRRLAVEGIPLDMCPLSNQRLGVVPNLKDHPAARFLDAGITITISSDDPAYFGGYIADNYVALAEALALSREQLATLAASSLAVSWR
ncbi:MAG: adenosine deaminase [Actinobacteria bacterium]|nr:adenosine deaminase [Actinomycetota bacterium]